jgi:DNA-binding transcriptional LysR family regulator
MDINYYKTFREVAKWKSFTQSAEVLGYAQSSVTTQIQKLEEEYGVKLFERWGRGIRLTPAGDELLKYTEDLLDILEKMKEKVSENEVIGTANIGTVESLASFFLPPYLNEFKNSYPGMKLFLQRGICGDLIEGVKEGKFDFSIILDEKQTDPDLEIFQIRNEEVVLISSPQHKLANKTKIEITDLEGESLVVTEEGCSYRSLIEKTLREYNVKCDFSFELGSLESIKQCVSYGLGISILPKIAVMEEYKNGRISVLPFSHPTIQVYTQIIYHKKKWLSKHLQHLIQILKQDAREINSNK